MNEEIVDKMDNYNNKIKEFNIMQNYLKSLPKENKVSEYFQNDVSLKEMTWANDDLGDLFKAIFHPEFYKVMCHIIKDYDIEPPDYINKLIKNVKLRTVTNTFM
ncbi:hypothetical protein [Staphylococcus phage vB_StaM_SA1]|nr:hypothetical protein [Staphylococcus phage vB_StaM_SA1]